MHRQQRLVAWPLTCPWRLSLTTAACKASTRSTFAFHSLHSTFPLRSPSSSVAHEHPDLFSSSSHPGAASVEVVLPSQPQPQKKDHRTRIHQSLDKLVARDLSCLLMASGLPLTGTKPILANRLVTYLASIMDKIDNLEPEFFLHNSSSCNSVTTPFRNATSTSFPRASFFSSVATNPAASTVENTDTDITLPLDNHSNGSGGQIDAEMMAKIKDRILPRSIVSIDIGIRNLAWVELSKDGEILRWAIEDLVPPSPTLDDRPNSALKEDEDEEWTGADNKTKRRSSSTKRANKKQAPVSSPYDPRAMALRLDTVMRTILESNTVDGIILERQRFRSRGMPMVLDSAFKCGVIEGMIHTWFAFWEREQSSRGGKRLAEGEDEDDRKGERKVPMFIESVPPRAVAVRWGIGASGAQAKDALSRRKKKQELLGSVDTVADAIESDTVSGPAEEESSNVQSPARPKKSLTYHHKKTQSRSIVNQWIHDKPSSDSSSSSDPADTGLVTGLSPPSKFQVRCSPAMKEWYRQEQKQDDLSDCLLQAVAWFEWKDRAVQEAVERSMLTGDGDGKGEKVGASLQTKLGRSRSKRAAAIKQ